MKIATSLRLASLFFVLIYFGCSSSADNKIKQTIRESIDPEIHFIATFVDANMFIADAYQLNRGANERIPFYVFKGKIPDLSKISIKIEKANKKEKQYYVAGIAAIDAVVDSNEVPSIEGAEKIDLRKGDPVHILCIFRDVIEEDGFGNYQLIDRSRMFLRKEVFDEEMSAGTPAAKGFQDYIKSYKKFPNSFH